MSFAAINQSTLISKAGQNNWYRLRSSGVEINAEGNMSQFDPDGSKLSTQSNLNTEMTKVTIKGVTDYNDILIWLHGVFKHVSSALVPTATLAYEHNFIYKNWESNNVILYDIYSGSTDYAELTTNVKLSQFGIKLPRTGQQEISGAGIGDSIKDSINDAGITFPTTDDVIPESPALAVQWACYLSDTKAGLNTANMLYSPFNMEVMLDSITNAMFGYNRTTSPNEKMDSKPKTSFKLKLPINAESSALKQTMRKGETKWLRLQSIGNTIESNIKDKFEFDFAVKVSSVPSKGTEQGALSYDYEFILTLGNDGSEPTIKLINAIDFFWL